MPAVKHSLADVLSRQARKGRVPVLQMSGCVKGPLPARQQGALCCKWLPTRLQTIGFGAVMASVDRGLTFRARKPDEPADT